MRREPPSSISPSAAVRVLENCPPVPRPTGNVDRREAAAALIEQEGPALLAAPGHTVRVPDATGGSVRLSLRRGPGPGGVDPGQFASLKPVEDYRVRSASGFYRTPAWGVPLVATLRPVLPVSVAGPVPPRPVPGVAWAVMALPVVQPVDPKTGERAVTLDLYDPHDAPPRVRDAAVTPRPLAADYSTPLAVTFARFGPQERGWRGFLGFGQQDFSSAGLYATESPTPDKTPLVLVHGLISDPTDSHDLQNRLEADPPLSGVDFLLPDQPARALPRRWNCARIWRRSSTGSTPAARIRRCTAPCW